VGRAHGLDGSFYVTRPRSRLLELGAKVTIDGKTMEIVRRAGTEQRPIVRVGDVEDRAGAEALRGLALTVSAQNVPALGEGEWWAHELEGCVVVDGSRFVGKVVRLVELPSCEALEVLAQPVGESEPAGESEPVGELLPASGSEPVGEWLLVPMVKDAIRTVDVAAGRIDVDMDFVEG
jgi:16S rRNA processing protein RimM